jgi:hypothetical protein
MELYRRGILQPPEPRVIELSAQLIGGGDERKVEVRWRAREALKVSLYQAGGLIGDEFRPSDAYEGTISQTTRFRLVADYGDGEIAEQVTDAVLYSSGSDPGSPGAHDTEPLFNKPEAFDLSGSPTKIFNDLADRIRDDKIRSIEALTLEVDQVIDYRKMGTTLPLLTRYPFEIEQYVTIQTGQQYVRLEYQGDRQGFQSFFNTLNGLLNRPETQANLTLKIMFSFDPPIAAEGSEMKGLEQALNRNPVERMNLHARVEY